MGEEVCTSPVHTAGLTSMDSFSTLPVSSTFHGQPFTLNTLIHTPNKGKASSGFTDRDESSQHRDRGIELGESPIDGNKLLELCQHTDGVSTLGKGDSTHLTNQSTNKHNIQDSITNNQDTKGLDIDLSDASDLLQEIQEENKNRMHDIYTPAIEVPSFHVDETSRLEMEKLSQEKNALFSENLGLIAKDSKEFKNLTQLKCSRKRVRTRQPLSNLPSLQETSGLETGHKHVKGTYRCGGCYKSYTEVCKLHDHLVNHGHGGSYHYDHILKTAFPKYDSACAFTQTTPDKQDIAVDTQPFKYTYIIKPKNKSVVEKETSKEDNVTEIVVYPPAKRKRRGKVRGVGPVKKPGQPNKGNIISKLRVKTEDGGNTWQGIKQDTNLQTENTKTDGEEKASFDVDMTLNGDKPSSENEDRMMKISPVNEHLDLENDEVSMIDEGKSKESPESKSEKKSRKRKMSVPRKLIPSDSMPGKIVNSRAKPEKKISCDFCPSKFQYTRGLMRHEQEKHADEMKFQCEICNMKFMREYNKERHLLCAHTSAKSTPVQVKESIKNKKKPGRKPRESPPEADITCKECGKILPESKAVIHARMHTGDRPFICHFCGKGLISDKKLKRHLLIHSSANRHKCEVCGHGFSMKYKLKTHMYIHTGHKPYLCSVCGAEFNNSTSLLHHHRTVHLGDKRFECTICGGKYGKKSQLEEHMFSHSKERTQTCRYCGKTFKHAKSLRRHEASHLSDNKYECDQCDSKFSRKDNLERHKMCHFDVILQCRFCKKKFRERAPLDEHEQFHINQKRLQCYMCKEKFLDESYFYKHMENEHDMRADMLPAITILPPTSRDDLVVEEDNILLSSLKLPVNIHGEAGGHPSMLGHDTLNMTMNAAGICPTSCQELLGPDVPSNVQSLLGTQHTFNTTSHILNQPLNPGYITSNPIVSGINDGQRAIVNVIHGEDPAGLRLPLDQSPSDIMMIHEQQRLMQEALGTSLNIPNPGYRLQNMY